jgi:TatD DNase family protein
VGIAGFIDSHAHLTDKSFANDLEEVIKRAYSSIIVKIVVPSIDVESSVEAFIIAATHDNIYATVGFHPHEAKDCSKDAFEQIRRLATEPKVVAIGEIGLDYFYNHSPHETQKDCFRQQLELAKQLSKPIVIHCRDAFADLVPILRDEKYRGISGVCHCFSGTKQDAALLLEMGFYISFAGSITFPKADKLREVVPTVPLNRMLLETDAPYLAPQALRGKRNEPAFVIHNADKVAWLHHADTEKVAAITTANSESLFVLSGKQEQRTLTYKLGNNLYINVTGNCTNDCLFCPRKHNSFLGKYNLRLYSDVSAEDIIREIDDPSKYDEVVFCGFGEPLLKFDVVKAVATWLKKNHAQRIRIDTNGQANLIYKRNVVPELKGIIDAFSISLNACNADEYQRICRPYLGIRTYDSVVDFIKECKKHFPDVTVSIVEYGGISAEKARYLVEKELGCRFRMRSYKSDLQG